MNVEIFFTLKGSSAGSGDKVIALCSDAPPT